MAEYGQLLPLWDKSPSPDKWFGPFEQGVLGLSEGLETRLLRWNERFETLMGSNLEWPSPKEHLAFVADGHLLAADAQREFGSRVVVLYLEADEERSQVPRIERPKDEAWIAGGPVGRVFSAPPPRKTISEQMWEMSDVEFEALTRNVDIRQFLWAPGQKPARVLLHPQEEGLPLVDRSAVIGMTNDRLEPVTLGLTELLVTKLHEWNNRWVTMPRRQVPALDESICRYLVEGHELAARVQQEVGPGVAVLFPEADGKRSRPSDEMQEFINRLRARGDNKAFRRDDDVFDRE